MGLGGGRQRQQSHRSGNVRVRLRTLPTDYDPWSGRNLPGSRPPDRSRTPPSPTPGISPTDSSGRVVRDPPGQRGRREEFGRVPFLRSGTVFFGKEVVLAPPETLFVRRLPPRRTEVSGPPGVPTLHNAPGTEDQTDTQHTGPLSWRGETSNPG